MEIDYTNPYLGVIAICDTLIFSYNFNIVGKYTNIPSVAGLVKNNKEFLIYESTFSDIPGIMLFYFILDYADTAIVRAIIFSVTTNILSTVVKAVVVTFLLVLLLQRINTQVKLFLLMTVLVLLYSVAKMLHFSSLLIVIVFRMILNNYKNMLAENFKPGLRKIS